MDYYWNERTDPAYNLALEEVMTAQAYAPFAMLWRNRPAVIIGRNQNACREFDSDYAREHGIAIVRRMTGGGAVYHDLGNLNYSIFAFESDANKRYIDFAPFAEPVLSALRALGVNAEFSGRNDILVNGRKVSGSAKCVHAGRILFHGTPARYVRAFTKSAGSAAGIILQFPFYAGIMGIITGVGASGICFGTVISDACIGISTPTTFPLLTFLCAAVLNLFVPSGGGHWAIQAPVFFTAGADLGVDPGLTGISIAWGDAWTNLIQPFWALPALAIAKLNAKDIMGFCLIDLVVTGLIICGGLLFWAM